jgi:iron(III) transport system ATP-binding protein
VLLDEPFSALDTDLRVDTRSAVRRLRDAAGIAAILVTHDRDDALGFADEVALMDARRVVPTGAPAVVYT